MLLEVVIGGATPCSKAIESFAAGVSVVDAQRRPPSNTAMERIIPLKIMSPGSSQFPPIIVKINRDKEMPPDSTQKKQKASILKIINPNKIRLKTVIPHDRMNNHHQVFLESSFLFSESPGKSGKIAKERTAK